MADATLPTAPHSRTGMATARRFAARRRAMIEDIEWMLDTRRCAEEITSRVGVRGPSLARSLDRWGRHDLARHFDTVAAR